MELFHHLQELRSNMTVREKSTAEYPQKGQLPATTRSGTQFSKEFSKLFPFQPPAWHLGHFKGIPGDGNQPPSTPSAQNTPARETCGDTDSATPQLAKIHGMSAEPASQSDVPPSRPWQWEFIFALMRVYFPGQTIELKHCPSAKYLGKAVEPIYCPFSLSKAHKALTKESELPLRSCPALLCMERWLGIESWNGLGGKRP